MLPTHRASQMHQVYMGDSLPEDLQAVVPSVAGHRLRLRQETGIRDPERIGEELLEAVPVP